jgi:hypothetical protein
MEMGLFEQNVTDRENKPKWIADEPVTYELLSPLLQEKIGKLQSCARIMHCLRQLTACLSGPGGLLL